MKQGYMDRARESQGMKDYYKGKERGEMGHASKVEKINPCPISNSNMAKGYHYKDRNYPSQAY